MIIAASQVVQPLIFVLRFFNVGTNLSMILRCSIRNINDIVRYGFFQPGFCYVVNNLLCTDGFIPCLNEVHVCMYV